MKYAAAIVCLAAVAFADVSHLVHTQHSADVDAVALRQEVDVRPDSYAYHYENSNGIAAQEQGQLKNVGTENEAIEVQGSNQHTAPDGAVYSLSYIANENGYQPQGAHLPTPPPPQPIPDYILRSIEYNEKHAPKN